MSSFDLTSIGRILILVGLLIAALGAIIFFLPDIPYLGKLPGDIRIKRDNFTIYIPITTCILLSILMTIIISLFNR